MSPVSDGNGCNGCAVLALRLSQGPRAQLRMKVNRHVAYGPPRDFRIEEHGDRLVMSRGPALKGGLFGTIGVLVVGLCVLNLVSHFYPIAAGVFLTLFLLVYFAAIYRLCIVV